MCYTEVTVVVVVVEAVLVVEVVAVVLRRIVLSNQNIGQLNDTLSFGYQLAFAFTFYSH